MEDEQEMPEVFETPPVERRKVMGVKLHDIGAAPFIWIDEDEDEPCQD